MKRPVGWLLGGLAVAGAYAWGRLRRPYAEPQPAGALPPPSEPAARGPDPRAEELRLRLEEAKTLVEERDAFEGETPVDRADSAPDPGDRRHAVHEQARAAADEMRGS